MAVIFGLDVSSYQGYVDWKKIWGAGIRFGFSKVTQSTNYLNPTWHHNLAGMTALGNGFVPGAYHFLTAGNGAAQARYFVQAVGGAARCRQLAIALDVEPTEGSRPSIADAKAWVAEFRKLVQGHSVIGYVPGWYHAEIGTPSLTFLDAIWQSNYVTGSGSPSALYAKVGQTRWAGYGGRSVSILQFSSTGRVSGVSGDCDVNAYRGTVAQLHALAIGGAPSPDPEDDVPEYVSLSTKKPITVKKGQAVTVTWDKVIEGVHREGKGIVPVDPALANFEITCAVPHQLYGKKSSEKDEHDLGTNNAGVVKLGKGEYLYMRLNPIADGTVTPYIKATYWPA